MSVVRWVSVVVLVCGCGPAVATDEGSGAEADGTGDSGTSTSGAATTLATATTAGTTVSTTDTTTTTTGPSGCAADWVTGCQSYCAANITCHPDLGTYEECVTGCIDGFGELTPDCQVLWCEAYTCMGTLDCASFDSGTPECDMLGNAAEKACGDGGGDCFVGAGPDGSCEYGCSDPPRQLSCNATTCLCQEDGAPTASCPTDGICDQLDAIEEYAKTCCGW